VEAFKSVRDRETLLYPARGKRGYDVSCTIQKDVGLTYLVIMRGDWKRTARE